MAGEPLTAVKILAKLGQVERRVAGGEAAALACKRAGITERTYKRWRKEYGGLERKLLARDREIEACGQALADARGNADDRLRQSEERYDFAMRAINEGVYDWNVAEGTIYYSERVRAATGMTPEVNRTPRGLARTNSSRRPAEI